MDAKKFTEKHWVPFLMAASDVVVLEFAVYFALELRLLANSILPIQLGPETYVGMTIAVPLVVIVYWVMGLYPGYGLNPIERFRKRLIVLFSVFPAMVAWDYLFQDGQWSRGILMLTFFLALFLIPLAELFVISILIRLKCWGIPVVVGGFHYLNEDVLISLRQDKKIGLVPVAYFDNDDAHWGGAWHSIPVIGKIVDAKSMAQDVDIMIVIMTEENNYYMSVIFDELPFKKILVAPDLGSVQSLWVTVRDLGGIVGLEFKQNLLIIQNRIVKRVFDILIGGIALLLALPLICMSALLVKIISPGPAFYAQPRTGFGGDDILVWKIRTMQTDAEERLERYLSENPKAKAEWEQYFKLTDDPRIIPYIGSALRRWSIDELPQLLGVLMGKLSLVGPRPFPDYHLKNFDPIFRKMRQNVRPGLTGLWQVSSRSSGALDNQEKLDTYYIQNWSLWLDFYILARTVTAVILTKNAR